MKRERYDIVDNLAARTAESVVIAKKTVEPVAEVGIDFLFMFFRHASRRNELFASLYSVLAPIYIDMISEDKKRLDRIVVRGYS